MKHENEYPESGQDLGLMLVILAILIVVMATSCSPVIGPKRGCPTNQGMIGYR